MSSDSDTGLVSYREKKKKKHRSRSRSPRERKKVHHREGPSQHHHHHDRKRDRSPERHRDFASRPIKKEPEDDDARRHHRRREADSRRRDPHGEEHAMKNQKEERRKNDQRRVDHRRRRNDGGNPFKQEPEDEQEYGQPGEDGGDEPAADREKPNFELSGKLTEDTNTFRGVVIKYNEPPEARKPRKRWRLYPFKGEEALQVWHMHRQSAYMLGRDRRIADLPIDHPSCSKQHAVFQFRLMDYERADGSMGKRILPYIIDLGSANGTYVNNQRIEAQCYVELLEKDVVKFGFSSREYVLMHDSMNIEDDDGAEDASE